MTRAADDLPVVIETGPGPVAVVIWLHGLGADGHDFEPIVPELRLPTGWPIRFVFPNAPYRPVTINGGYVMRAWYDLALDSSGLRQDSAHIRESEMEIRNLLATEIRHGIPSRRIVLAGFSQGAAMAIHTGLRFDQPLAGILALSMPIPMADRIPAELDANNRSTPIFLAHGDDDQVVPYAIGELGRRVLEGAGLPVEWHSYSMGHTVCAEEIADIREWLISSLELTNA